MASLTQIRGVIRRHPGIMVLASIAMGLLVVYA